MKELKKILIVLPILLTLLLTGCTLKNETKNETTVEEVLPWNYPSDYVFSDSEEESIKELEKVGVNEAQSKDAVWKLKNIGCGQITNVEVSDGNNLNTFIVADINGNQYKIYGGGKTTTINGIHDMQENKDWYCVIK